MEPQKLMQGGEAAWPPAPAESGKRRYRSPHLVEYGDLRSLTAAKGGHKSDKNGTPLSTKP